MKENTIVSITVIVCITILLLVGTICFTTIEHAKIKTFPEVELKRAESIGYNYWKGLYEGLKQGGDR